MTMRMKMSTNGSHAGVDPFGGMPSFTGRRLSPLFETLTTYQAINDRWAEEPSRGFVEDLEFRGAAVNRSRALRSTPAPLTPTELPDSNRFRLCQNDPELVELYSLMTEEPPGDGGASRAFVRRWHATIVAEATARRTELQAAGIVNGPMPI